MSHYEMGDKSLPGKISVKNFTLNWLQGFSWGLTYSYGSANMQISFVPSCEMLTQSY